MRKNTFAQAAISWITLTALFTGFNWVRVQGAKLPEYDRFEFGSAKTGASRVRQKGRKIASIAPVSRTSGTTSSRLASTLTAPTPVFTPISADNPIKPRVGSAQAGDPPILNLLNFFNLNRVNQPGFPEAKCNDGSQPAYYLKKGFGAGASRWVIWLEGGGGCGSDDPLNPLWCGNRKNGYLNTGNSLPSALGDFQGIMSKSEVYNADFYSYNQVIVHYCSSDFWMGTGTQKVINPSTGEKFWFSGKKIVSALVADLKQRYGLGNATNVILTGSSAGGAGIAVNADEVKASLPTTDVVTLIDASNFFAYHHFVSAFTPADQVEYISEPSVFQQCYGFLPAEGNRNCLAKRFKNQCGPNERCANLTYECMLPGEIAPYLSMPIFMASDQLDNQILASYGLSLCQNTQPDDYQTWLGGFISASTAKAKAASGYFLPRTGDHGLAPTHHWTTPVTENGASVRLKEVFGAWYFGRAGNKRFVQSASATLMPHQESNPGLCQ